MTPRRFGICIDANDPGRVAEFWAEVLGREAESQGDEIRLLPRAADDFRIRFVTTDAPKTLENPHHLHLTSSLPEDQQRTVDRLLGLGATHLEVGQRPDEDHIVLGDPEGNELCVIPAGNSWLAGTGFLGEVAADGSRETGMFWSAALGWPLVWDQDGETAVATPSVLARRWSPRRTKAAGGRRCGIRMPASSPSWSIVDQGSVSQPDGEAEVAAWGT